ncbi:MAG: glycosyltransferase family 39 protein [Anaerolineae bacterium]
MLPNLLILVLLYTIFAQAVASAASTSITIDEGLHITSGYSILRTGDFRLVEEHPPLVKLLEALPLLAVLDLPDPTTLPGWESDVAVTDSVRLVRATQAIVYPYQPIDRLVFAARVPVALLAVLLGAVVFRWASDLWGWKGGLLALFLLTFDPNILAHAAVAGTDLGATCFITLALFSLARFLRRPTPSRLMLAGVTLGLAQGAKLSALILLPVVVLLGVLTLPRHRITSLFLLLTIAGLVLWAFAV